MRARNRVAGSVVAVTGGARGIGREIASHLAAAGARVALGDLDGDAARRTAEELGNGVLGLQLDVTSTESFTLFLARVEQELDPLDVLVNNAGVMWVGPFQEEPEAIISRQVAVNLLGVMRGVRLAVPAMKARGTGHIVTIASAASVLTTPGEATYAATKHGVHGYLKAVREELHGSGVRVTVVMPAVVETELAAGTATGAARLLQPEDVARAVIDAIRRPRFAVSVPGYVGPLNRGVDLLPQVMRDAATRRLVPNQLRQSDPAARAGYHSRLESS